MATHSSIFAWRIPWTEKSGGYSLYSRKESVMTEVAEHTCMHADANVALLTCEQGVHKVSKFLIFICNRNSGINKCIKMIHYINPCMNFCACMFLGYLKRGCFVMLEMILKYVSFICLDRSLIDYHWFFSSSFDMPGTCCESLV